MPEPAAWPADRRITITDLQAATDRGERWSMLTSYDALTAGVFEQAGVRALLVGDTSAEMVLGFQTTVPMTADDDGSAHPDGAGGGARDAYRARGRRPAVRQLRGRPRGRAAERGQAPAGGRGASCQAGGRAPRSPPGPGDDGGRHPGDGTPRADPAEHQHARRRTAGPGPRHRGRTTPRGRPCAPGCGRVRRGARVGPRRSWPAGLGGAPGPDGRHRRWPVLRRSDPGLAGYGRA